MCGCNLEKEEEEEDDDEKSEEDGFVKPVAQRAKTKQPKQNTLFLLVFVINNHGRYDHMILIIRPIFDRTKLEMAQTYRALTHNSSGYNFISKNIYIVM